MFGIGGFELFLILLFGFLIFGPDKLPAIAKTVGQALAKFRTAQEEMNKVIKTEVYDPTSDEPFKNPLEALEKVGKTAQKTAKDVAKPASKAAEKPAEKTETFSERKARYDKERAEKKAAEAAEAAKSETAAPAQSKAASDKPKPTADELYGAKPAAEKKVEASVESSSAASEEKGE